MVSWLGWHCTSIYPWADVLWLKAPSSKNTLKGPRYRADGFGSPRQRPPTVSNTDPQPGGPSTSIYTTYVKTVTDSEPRLAGCWALVLGLMFVAHSQHWNTWEERALSFEGCGFPSFLWGHLLLKTWSCVLWI